MSYGDLTGLYHCHNGKYNSKCKQIFGNMKKDTATRSKNSIAIGVDITRSNNTHT